MSAKDFFPLYCAAHPSVHWCISFDRNQVTIHPMMIYYKIKEENKETLVKHAIVGISEDNKHDADAVLEFEKQALDIVSKDICIQIKEIHQWTDGCAAQYKGKIIFTYSNNCMFH
jgi:DNA-binding GntR family transcriptional regulator